MTPTDPAPKTPSPQQPPAKPQAPPPRPWRVEKHLPGTQNTPSCNPNFRPPPPPK